MTHRNIPNIETLDEIDKLLKNLDNIVFWNILRKIFHSNKFTLNTMAGDIYDIFFNVLKQNKIKKEDELIYDYVCNNEQFLMFLEEELKDPKLFLLYRKLFISSLVSLKVSNIITKEQN